MSSARDRLKAANSANQKQRVAVEQKESNNLIDDIVKQNEAVAAAEASNVSPAPAAVETPVSAPMAAQEPIPAPVIAENPVTASKPVQESIPVAAPASPQVSEIKPKKLTSTNQTVQALFKKEKELKSYHKNYLITATAKEKIELLAASTGRTENAVVNEIFENLFEILGIEE